MSVLLSNVTVKLIRSYIAVGATESTLLVCMLNLSDVDLVISDARAGSRG